LKSRTLLNPDSSGSGVYLLQLLAPSASSWLAGDLVEVMPRNSPWLVEYFRDGLGLSGEARVQLDGLEESLEQALGSRQLPENRT
ncbi:hypothetical protein, partial [Pseudomonas sp. SIMBA_068]|uniref:hypothetical protein n=1 Tax=Pseudomonas sp. SIMBA_068 TaxID=3085808 RepID=UPI00397D95D7